MGDLLPCPCCTSAVIDPGVEADRCRVCGWAVEVRPVVCHTARQPDHPATCPRCQAEARGDVEAVRA